MTNLDRFTDAFLAYELQMTETKRVVAEGLEALNRLREEVKKDFAETEKMWEELRRMAVKS